MAEIVTTPTCPDLACKRVRWALHVLRTLERDGGKARVAASLGLQMAFAEGGSPGVWRAALELAADALYGWEPESPEPLPPVVRLERCPHDELPKQCVICVGDRLRTGRLIP